MSLIDIIAELRRIGTLSECLSCGLVDNVPELAVFEVDIFSYKTAQRFWIKQSVLTEMSKKWKVV
jgi:hypothetical protein